MVLLFLLFIVKVDKLYMKVVVFVWYMYLYVIFIYFLFVIVELLKSFL